MTEPNTPAPPITEAELTQRLTDLGLNLPTQAAPPAGAYRCAQTCAVNALAGVLNGASELLGHLFGDRGTHARSAVGVAVLPLDAPVEVELVIEFA